MAANTAPPGGNGDVVDDGGRATHCTSTDDRSASMSGRQTLRGDSSTKQMLYH